MTNRISVNNLSKKMGAFELKGVSFDVPAGTVVGLIGENGAGKTSAIKALLGINDFDEGEITIDGRSVRALGKKDKQRVGIVLDDVSLPENLTLPQLGHVMKHMFRQWDGAKFEQYANAFGLPSDKAVKEFSKGMKTKTAIAVALSHSSDTLVLDEPTSGLDPVARDEILDILYSFMENENHAILISSHIISDLEKLCDYIVFIHEGRIVLTGAKDELTAKYAVIRCGREELAPIEQAVVSVLPHVYGTEALIDRNKLTAPVDAERADLEKLMLFFIKGERL